jgi:ribonuclease BN (tRNA processing enzyme)
MSVMRRLVPLGLLALVAACSHGSSCARDRAVQVLGSGGPIPDDARASSGYVVWSGGRARVLVDAGGGVFQRFGQAGADLGDLELVALTHLHADHCADLPALLKGAYFVDRRRDLVLTGPTGRGPFPALGRFVALLFEADQGAFSYLSWLLDPRVGAFTLDVRELDADARASVDVPLGGGLQVAATGVAHGPVPALAYRIELEGRSVVFSGDQNGANPHFAAFARGADVLVMHHAIAEFTGGAAARLHARPSEIGRIARAAEVEHLVLSHHMRRSLVVLDEGLAEIRAHYRGRITVAEDMTCVPLP